MTEINLAEKLTDAEMFDLGQTRNEIEWNAVCDRIKAARGGHYPREWFNRIIRSGFLTQTKRSWALGREIDEHNEGVR